MAINIFFLRKLKRCDSYSLLFLRRHDTQYDDTQQNDNQHNDTQHNDTQHNDTQQITLTIKVLSVVLLSLIMLGFSFFTAKLSVSMLKCQYAEVSVC